MKKLKIFSDKKYLPSPWNPVFLLAPFWEKYSGNGTSSSDIKFDQFPFEMAPLEDADFAVVPIDWMRVRGVSWSSRVDRKLQDLEIQFVQNAEQAGKPVIVFFTGDCSDEEIPIKNAAIFRGSIYRSRKKPNDFAFPYFCGDFVKGHFSNELPVRHKREKPVVGFCGFARKKSWEMRLKEPLYHAVMLARQRRLGLSPYTGQILRTRALEILENSSRVDTNFIKRDNSFFGKRSEQKEKARFEYVHNMVESDYLLCCRGVANYSNRLYEILSCGRIPVFIDTDCVLPYEFEIDWKKYCVWVDEKELPWIDEKVADFHSQLSPKEFIDLQHECRKLWKEWLSPEGFFNNLYRHFRIGKTR